MKNLPFIFVLLFLGKALFCQTTTVQATGMAAVRQQAIDNALHNAVCQAIETNTGTNSGLQNKSLIQQALSINANAIIAKYAIITEQQHNNLYEITVNAEVNQANLLKNSAILEQYVGGIRFLVLYDSRMLTPNTLPYYEMAYERFNEKLIESGLRYVEKSRFDALKAEAAAIFGNDTSEASYVQKLGLFADAQFILFIKSITLRTQTKIDNFRDTKVIIEAKAYDNCTAEGLGTVIMESDWKLLSPKMDELHLCFTSAIQKNFDRLFMLFYNRLATWVHGAPFELRFYGLGGPRNLRELVGSLQKNPAFGGTLEPVMVKDYIRINCNYRLKPFDMYNTVLECADSIPFLKSKAIDAIWQYGRQISFSPKDTLVSDAEQLKLYKKQ